MNPEVPENERERLAALHGCGILDTGQEAEFEDLARLAAAICAAPIGLVSLVDAGRQWFKARVGLSEAETSRDVSFCAHAILEPSKLFVVPDALEDERFKDNPLVTTEPRLRFYAGAPLVTPDGLALGTLCVADRVPRELTREQAEALEALGRQAAGQLELRRRSRQLAAASQRSQASEEALRASEELKTRLIESSPDCIKLLDLDARLLSMNAGGMASLEICDLSSVMGASWIEFWEGADRAAAEAAVGTARAGDVGRFVGFFATTVSRTPKWWDVVVSPIRDKDGRTERLLAVSRDVTERQNAVDGLEQAIAEERGLRAELKALLEVNVAVARHMERDELFGALARCLGSLMPAHRFGIELPIEGGARLQAHVLGSAGPAASPAQVEVLPAAGTACHFVQTTRQPLVAASRNELRTRFPVTFEVMEREGMESLCALPLQTAGNCRGVLFFMAESTGAYDDVRRGRLEQVAAAVAVALDNCLAHEEVARLSSRLAAENLYLQEEIRQEHNFSEMVGSSPALVDVLQKVERIAPLESTVLVTGETGTGKELIARAIHDRSARKDRPLVKVNCGAISAGLVESELFGHVKGAFTGALERRQGRFELAHGGTIFLDEIGELPLETQVKLLRVLQEQEFEPVGSSRTVKIDVRVIAATNRDLAEAMQAGRLRSDLFFRLNVVPLRVPPLRERRSDIPALVAYYVSRFSRRFGKAVDGVTQETMALLVAYAWPGNVRELQNVIERAIVLATGPVLALDADLSPVSPPRREDSAAGVPPLGVVASDDALEVVERHHIERVLASTRGVIEGPTGAARILSLHPNTLRSRMKKLGVQRPHEMS